MGGCLVDANFLEALGCPAPRTLRGSLLAAALATALAACAETPPEVAALDPGNNDPAESVNRAVFAANMAVDHTVMRPIAEAYQEHLPAPVRRGIHNATANLNEPVVAANDLLQGNLGRSWTSIRRFAINSTAGAAGVVDRAADWNLPPHSADFGQTLAVWGVGEGPFVELPALGPSNLRDAVGTAVGIAADPLALSGVPALGYLGYARTTAQFVDARAAHLSDLDDIERSSLDVYSTLRSVYRQHRQAEINEAKNPAPDQSGP